MGLGSWGEKQCNPAPSLRRKLPLTVALTRRFLVAVGRGRRDGSQRPNRRHEFGPEFEIRCRETRFELLERPRTDERCRDGGVTGHPCDGERRRMVAVSPRECGETLGDVVVGRVPIANLVHRVAHQSSRIGALIRPIFSRQESASERAVREHAQTQFGTAGQDLDFGLSFHQVVHRLNANDRCPASALRHSHGETRLPCREIADRRIDHLARGHELLDAPQDLLEGCALIEAMQKQDVDPIGSKSSQAGLDRTNQMIAAAPSRIRSGGGREVGLRGENHFVALGRNQTPENFFGSPTVVDVCTVEEVDADFATPCVDPSRRGLIGISAERHRAQTERRHTETSTTEERVLHGANGTRGQPSVKLPRPFGRHTKPTAGFKRRLTRVDRALGSDFLAASFPGPYSPGTISYVTLPGFRSIVVRPWCAFALLLAPACGRSDLVVSTGGDDSFSTSGYQSDTANDTGSFTVSPSTVTFADTTFGSEPLSSSSFGETFVDTDDTDDTGFEECQRTVDGDVVVDDFGDFEELFDVSVIRGNLTVQGVEGLFDLFPLFCLTRVEGTFSLLENPDLPNLFGLDRLAEVESLVVESNPQLFSLSGLFSLFGVNGDLRIRSNVSLPTLSDLLPLGFIGGTLEISDNDSLFDLFSIESITSVGSVSITENDNLTTLEGLGSITGLAQLELRNNASLSDIFALSSLREATGIRIEGNPSLTTLTGLFRVEGIGGGGLQIIGNANLPSLEGLGNITQVDGEIRIEGNEALTALADLDDVENVGSHIIVTENPLLTDVSPLGSVDSIGGWLVIDRNAALTSVQLNDLRSIGAVLSVSLNPLLTTTEFPDLESVGTDARFLANGSMTQLDGFPNLTSIGGALRLENNVSLLGITEFNIEEVEGNVTVSGNTVLGTVDLGDLTFVNGSLIVSENDALTTVDFGNLLAVAGELRFQGHSALSSIAAPNLTDIGNGFSLLDNSTIATPGAFDGLVSILGDFTISGNANLTSLGSSFPVLSEVSSQFGVTANPSLPTCDATELARRIEIGGLTVINGNLPPQVCPP